MNFDGKKKKKATVLQKSQESSKDFHLPKSLNGYPI